MQRFRSATRIARQTVLETLNKYHGHKERHRQRLRNVYHVSDKIRKSRNVTRDAVVNSNWQKQANLRNHGVYNTQRGGGLNDASALSGI